MPGPGELPAPHSAPIIGREAALARLRGLVDPVPSAGQVLLVTGEAGMGKTVLLADAADRARRAGMRGAVGHRPRIGVQARVRRAASAPAAGTVQRRPPPRSAGPGAAGRARPRTGPRCSRPALVGVALLTLLSDLSEQSPVLVVADDAHWMDRSSRDALAFAGSRLDAERVVLLVGARGQAPPSSFDRGFPELHLEPLSAATPASCSTCRPGRPAGGRGGRCSPKRPVIPWR